MLFKEAVSKRIYELCNTYNYTTNKLAELSAVAPSTLQDMLALKVNKPNAYVTVSYTHLDVYKRQ